MDRKRAAAAALGLAALATTGVRETKAGRGATRDTWVSLVRGALGEPGVAEFEAMMAGRPLDLPSDLLGPRFRR